MKRIYGLMILLCGLLLQCAAPESQDSTTTTTATDSLSLVTPAPTTPQRPGQYYATVDRLRIRQAPDLSAAVVVMVEEGAALTFLGEVSEQTATVELRGKTTTAPFLKVKTNNGQEGWVHESALSATPINTKPYRVAIGYRHLEEDEEDISGDWGHYANEAIEAVEDLNIYFAFPEEEELARVQIQDDAGNIIGTENVKAMFEKHGAGFVLIERGKARGFVQYDTNMGDPIRAYFEGEE